MLFEGYLHANALWILASARVPFFFFWKKKKKQQKRVVSHETRVCFRIARLMNNQKKAKERLLPKKKRERGQRRWWVSKRIVYSLLKIVLQCLYLARIGRPDILWSVNKLARAVTKWTKACDKRLARLISYIHHTCECRKHCCVANTAQSCRVWLFQDYDFARDLEDSKSTSGGVLCIFGSHTFVPISWMCKKQISVSHSCTEAEKNSLDASLRMDGIPALTLWDLVIEIFHSVPNKVEQPKEALPSQTCITSSNASTPTSLQRTLTTFHPTQYILVLVPCCMSLKTMKPWLRWLSNVEVPRWGMFHGPTELLWIGCLTGLIWTPKSKSVTLTPSTKSKT